MLWRVKGKSPTKFVGRELMTFLLQTLSSKPAPDQEHLAVELVELFHTGGFFKELPLNKIILLTFRAGYYYRIFLTNNEVSIEAEDASESPEKSDN